MTGWVCGGWLASAPAVASAPRWRTRLAQRPPSAAQRDGRAKAPQRKQGPCRPDLWRTCSTRAGIKGAVWTPHMVDRCAETNGEHMRGPRRAGYRGRADNATTSTMPTTIRRWSARGWWPPPRRARHPRHRGSWSASPATESLCAPRRCNRRRHPRWVRQDVHQHDAWRWAPNPDGSFGLTFAGFAFDDAGKFLAMQPFVSPCRSTTARTALADRTKRSSSAPMGRFWPLRAGRSRERGCKSKGSGNSPPG